MGTVKDSQEATFAKRLGKRNPSELSRLGAQWRRNFFCLQIRRIFIADLQTLGAERRPVLGCHSSSRTSGQSWKTFRISSFAVPCHRQKCASLKRPLGWQQFYYDEALWVRQTRCWSPHIFVCFFIFFLHRLQMPFVWVQLTLCFEMWARAVDHFKRPVKEPIKVHQQGQIFTRWTLTTVI